MDWYSRITVHRMTNPENRDPRPLPIGIQPTAKAEDILEKSHRVMLEEFEKPATRTNRQYKSLITWVAAGKSMTCRSRATDVMEAAVMQPSTQPREHVPGRLRLGGKVLVGIARQLRRILPRGGEAGPSQTQQQQPTQFETQGDVPPNTNTNFQASTLILRVLKLGAILVRGLLRRDSRKSILVRRPRIASAWTRHRRCNRLHSLS